MEFGKNKLKQLKRRLKRKPDDYDSNIQLGTYYLKNEDIGLAIPYFEKACDIKKDIPELLFLLANSYKMQNDLKKSAHYFKSAIELEPENLKYISNYGVLLKETKRYEESIELFKRAIKLNPDNIELLNDLGVMCHEQEKFKEAIHYFKNAIELNGDYLVAQINLAFTYLKIKDLPSAQKTIESLEKIHPNSQEVYELRVRYNVIKNRTNEVIPSSKIELTFSDQPLKITPFEIIKKFSENGKFREISLSVVIPIKDEEENISVLYDELIAVLKKLKENYEIIFIDDGSTDNSREILAEIASKDNDVKVIQFRRNYGQTAAINAGFKYTRGSVVLTLDGDLQNDPADIPRLLEKMAEGYDLVSGWRKDRKDRFVKRKLPSMIANRIINWLIYGTGVKLHDFGCTLKAYKRGIIKNINLYGEMHRFIPVFAAWLGVKVAEIPVNHRPRIHGKAKYNLSRVSRVIFDLIVVRFFSDYLTRPIQFFGRIAKLLALHGGLIIFLFSALSMAGILAVSLNTLILLTAVLMFAILQILSIGLLGEIMIRSYFEGQNKDSYIVEKILNGKVS
jgi:glycosyltransferase involved in cell wall biosynthesis